MYEEFKEVHRDEHGLHHRLDGPAVITEDGAEYWYKDGKLHRDGGPAIEDGLHSIWFKNGKIHRLDGPAMTSDTASQWCINGTNVTFAVEKMAKDRDIDIHNMSDDDKIIITMLNTSPVLQEYIVYFEC